jgi:hypothetical protein
MKLLKLIVLLTLLPVADASANLCLSVKDLKVKSETLKEISLYKELFPNADYHGSHEYNGFLLECNRKRDTKGRTIRKMLTKSAWSDMETLLKKSDLSPYLYKAKYKFFGIAFFKMSYLIWKENDVWKMVLPYKPIINDVVKNRIDFNLEHAEELYEESQVTASGTGSNKIYAATGSSIKDTLCSTTTFFSGKSHKYDGKNDDNAHKRDRANKHIDLGGIQYSYERSDGTYRIKNGCRVKQNVHLYGVNPVSQKFEKILPEHWILNNFERIAEEHWSKPDNFELHVLLKGHNESRLESSVREHVNKYIKNSSYLKIRFGAKFLPNSNQMYKANVWQPNNFSTMTTDGTYIHEVGHAFGLDDEYAQKSKDKSRRHCEHIQYDQFDGTSGSNTYTINDYTMCDGYGDQVNTIYQYIAVSRYVLGEVCKKNSDCGAGRYCNNRLGTNRCLADRTSHVGDSCIKNRECKSGKCQGSGSKRACVCKKNSDCGSGKYCNNRLGKNRCLAKASLQLGETCKKNKECTSGKCQGSGSKRACVCKKNSDCSSGKYCNNRAGKNRCLAKSSSALGASCKKNKECKSGKCQGSGSKRACVCKKNSDCSSGKCKKRLGKNYCK